MEFSENGDRLLNANGRGLAVSRNADSKRSVIAQNRIPPNRNKDDSGGVGAKAILSSLRRKWPLALVLGLVIAPILAAGGWMVLKPQHPATAFLRVDSDNAPLAFQTADHVSSGIIAFKVYKNTQRQLVLSPLVLNSALASDSVRGLKEISQNGSPLQWLNDELKVTFPDDSEIMAVQLATGSPNTSKTIVDAVIDAYLNEAVLSERSERVRRLESLEKAHAEAEGKVRSKRAELRQLADTLGTSDSQSLSLAQQTALQQYGLLQTEINNVTYDLLKAEGMLESTKQQIALTIEAKENEDRENQKSRDEGKKIVSPTQISDIELEQGLAKDLEFQQIATEVRAIMKKLKDMERNALGPRFTESYRKELNDLREQLKARREVVRQMQEADLQQRTAVAESKAAMFVDGLGSRSTAATPLLEAKQALEVDILKKRKIRIEEDLKKFDEEVKKLGRSSIDIEMMRAEISSLDDVLKRLAGEIEHTKVELKSGSRISLVSKASLVDGADSKKRLAATAGGGLVGLILPFALLLLFDVRRKLLDDPKQLSENLKVELLGTVPNSKLPLAAIEPPVSRSAKTNYANIVESVNAIVALLVKKSSVDERQVLMISSSVASEGKSSLAQNLWSGLCEANYKCILIDLDLRRPSIHRYLKASIGLGVSDVLAGQSTLEESIQFNAKQHPFMTAGSSRRLNLAAMAAESLPNFFDDLRGKYDFIIVDSPPILPVVDSRIIGEHVDGAVLSTIRDRSRGPQTIAAIELLRAHGIEILGVVLNGYAGGTYGYSYHSD